MSTMTESPTTAALTDSATPALTVSGAVATITLRRPATHNRIEPDDVGVISSHLHELNGTPSVRVIVFRSEGKSFSSGFDLTRLAGTATKSNAQGYNNPFEQLCDAIENARAVTIARLHAPVYGGSTDLALACDFRLGAEGIRMFMPAARLGLHYYGHGIRRWVTRLGLGGAKKLFLTSRTIDAVEMLRIGYLDDLVPRDDLDQELQRWIDDLLAMAPIPLVSMKQVLNVTARQEYDEKAAARGFLDSLATQDLREALAAFAESRTPVFKGL
jgi:enoyl-CoA hydratase/carnithine racemase